MNIDKMIKKVLLEQETAVRGLNVNDQMGILEKGKLNCPTFRSEVGDRPIKKLGKSDILKFPELGSTEEAYYVSTPISKDGSIRMFFAIED